MEDIIGGNTCFNIGGYKSLYIADIQNVLSINILSNNRRSIILKEGFGYIQLIGYNITVNTEADKDAFTHNITCNIRTSDAIDEILHKLTKKRFIVKVIDNNNVFHIIGSLDEPLRFNFNTIGPFDPSDDKNYYIQLSGTTTEPQREC